MSDKEKLREYLNTRRQFWPYEDSYHVDKMGAHRFMAKIGDELAGLGIGTELLELLMDDLIASGFETIRYEIGREYYAFQIYQNLGFEVESQDLDTVRFVWRRK